MEEQAAEPVNGHGQRTENAGWFRPGDRRINREGRPRGSKIVKDNSPAPHRTGEADRVMLLFVPSKDMPLCLGPQKAPRVTNLPKDTEIVGGDMDHERDGMVLKIRSSEFPRIAAGAVIPDFEPTYCGGR